MEGDEYASAHQTHLGMENERLTRDGKAEPVSRDKTPRRARGQGETKKRK